MRVHVARPVQETLTSTAPERETSWTPFELLSTTVKGLVITASLLCAAALGLRYGFLVGIPALIGLPAIALAMSMEGRGVGEAPPLQLTIGAPAAVAQRLAQLEVMREELSSSLATSGWSYRVDLDVMQRLQDWLQRGASLSQSEQDWLERRGAIDDSLGEGLRYAITTSDSSRNRAATRSLVGAMLGYLQAAERAPTHLDPYR